MANATGSAVTKRPNFVFVLTDQQRRDSLGCYGNSIAQTPNIDRLARDGVVFDNAFTTCVVCMPARASILTGRTPQTHGAATNGCRLDPREITMPQVLADAGYRTAHVGKCHLSPHSDHAPLISGDEPNYLSPECPAFWAQKRSFALPYYGFQQALVCSGHGADWMHYHDELVARDPKLPALLKQESALQPPSGAPSSWKSAIGQQHHCTTWIGDHAIELLEGFSQGDDPFFLFVGIADPHFPYCPPAPWCDMFDPRSVPMPRRRRDEVNNTSRTYARALQHFRQAWPYDPLDIPEHHIREIIAHTYGMVAMLDHTVGRIMGALQRLNLSDNTIVIFTTDHGEHLGDHWLVYKAVFYDELCHVPLIWSCPTRFAAEMRSEGIVSHLDLMPTILALAGVAQPRGIQGASYAQGRATAQVSGRPYAYFEDDAEDGRLYARSVRTRDYRLSYYLPDGDGDLFDLRNDPDEFENRWNDPVFSSDRAAMMELLLQACIEATDPKPQRLAPY